MESRFESSSGCDELVSVALESLHLQLTRYQQLNNNMTPGLSSLLISDPSFRELEGRSPQEARLDMSDVSAPLDAHEASWYSPQLSLA